MCVRLWLSYVSQIRSNNAWFQFNDEVVTRVKPPGANSASDKDKAKGSDSVIFPFNSMLIKF